MKIISKGTDVYQGHCTECGCHFEYTRKDVRKLVGCFGSSVSCPHCGNECHHFGASGTKWAGEDR